MVLAVHGIGHGNGQLAQLALGRFQIVAGGKQTAQGAAKDGVVDIGLILAHGQLELQGAGVRIAGHRLELGHAAVEHQRMTGAEVDQHAAIGLGHGTDVHLLGELTNGLVPLIEQHQVLFGGALGAQDGLVEVIDAVEQAVDLLGLVLDTLVDGIHLGVELT